MSIITLLCNHHWYKSPLENYFDATDYTFTFPCTVNSHLCAVRYYVKYWLLQKQKHSNLGAFVIFESAQKLAKRLNLHEQIFVLSTCHGLIEILHIVLLNSLTFHYEMCISFSSNVMPMSIVLLFHSLHGNMLPCWYFTYFRWSITNFCSSWHTNKPRSYIQ